MELDALGSARQGFQLHALDVHLDQIEAGEVECVEADGAQIDHAGFGIIDRLADEFGAVAQFQL